VKLWSRVSRDTFPLWEVSDAEPDRLDPHRIRVRVRKPLGEDSHIKIKGNAINSGWQFMLMPFYWFGAHKIRIRKIDSSTTAMMVKLKAKVRVPELERQHSEELRKQRKKEMRKYKQGRM